jgi:hypothetical protein
VIRRPLVRSWWSGHDVGVRTQSDRDAATLAIFGALLVFAAVLLVGLVGAVVARWLGAVGDLPGLYLTGLVVVGAAAAGVQLARGTRRG